MKFISRFETPVNHKSIVKNSKPESRNMEFTHLEKKNIMSNLSEGRGGGGEQLTISLLFFIFLGMKLISRSETPVNHKSIAKNSKPESRNMEFTHLEKKNIMSNLSERGGGGG